MAIHLGAAQHQCQTRKVWKIESDSTSSSSASNLLFCFRPVWSRIILMTQWFFVRPVVVGLFFLPRRSSHEKPEEKKVNRTCCCFALNFRLVEVCDLANFSFLSSLKRSNSNQLRDSKFQFSLSFIARTHPQSFRQETSGGPYDIFLLHTSIFTLRCEDCFALSKKGAPSSLRWQPVAFWFARTKI